MFFLLRLEQHIPIQRFAWYLTLHWFRGMYCIQITVTFHRYSYEGCMRTSCLETGLMNPLISMVYPSQRTRQPGEAEQAAPPGADTVSSFPGLGPGCWNSLLRHRVALPAAVLQPRPGLKEPQTIRSQELLIIISLWFLFDKILLVHWQECYYIL